MPRSPYRIYCRDTFPAVTWDLVCPKNLVQVVGGFYCLGVFQWILLERPEQKQRENVLSFSIYRLKEFLTFKAWGSTELSIHQPKITSIGHIFTIWYTANQCLTAKTHKKVCLWKLNFSCSNSIWQYFFILHKRKESEELNYSLIPKERCSTLALL